MYVDLSKFMFKVTTRKDEIDLNNALIYQASTNCSIQKNDSLTPEILPDCIKLLNSNSTDHEDELSVVFNYEHLKVSMNVVSVWTLD